MGQTIEKGKAKDVDPGFIDIFKNDIIALPMAKEFKKELSEKLNELAKKISGATPILIDDKEEKLPPSPNREKAKEEAIEKGFQIAKEKYHIESIIGDGHCLFRATGTEHLRWFEKLSTEKQNQHILRIEALVNALNNVELRAKFVRYKTFLIMIREKRSTAATILGDRTLSSFVIAFLRHLACRYNERHCEHFAAKIEDGKSVDEYIKAMVEMKAPIRWGGELETEALAKALGHNIAVIDAERLGKFPEYTESLYPSHDGGADFTLLFKKNHFDIAKRKQLLIIANN